MISCDECDGKCCKYVVLEITGPKSVIGVEEIRWLLSHKNIFIFKDDENTWHAEFQTPCKYLDNQNKCKIYEKRSTVCRDHNHEECELNNEDGFNHILNFSDLDEFDKWAKTTAIGRKALEKREKL